LFTEVQEPKPVFASLTDPCIKREVQVVPVRFVPDSVAKPPFRKNNRSVSRRRWLERNRVRDIVLDRLELIE
jgi:hypothetical protein